MFYVDEGERVVEMIPGQGWRLVLAYDPEGVEPVDPQVVEEPIIAWAIVEKKEREDFGEGPKIQKLVPLVRSAYPRGYIWEFSSQDIGTVLLAPGEKRTPDHDKRAVERMEEILREWAEKRTKWDQIRKLRREGCSIEAISKGLNIYSGIVHAIVKETDEAMGREQK